MRPGAIEYIKRIQAHPRAVFGFLTPMKEKHARSLVQKFRELFGIQDIAIFGSEFHNLMSDNPNYLLIQTESWDRYGNIEKVIASNLCKQQAIDASRICVLDNIDRKVQEFINNAIVIERYSAEVIGSKPPVHQ